MVKRSDGRWQEVITVNGKRKYFYGKTKSIVLEKIRQYKDLDEKGALFETVADEWWEIHRQRLAYKSILTYAPAKKRAVAAFGNVPIKSILPTHINAEIERFSFQGHADKTVKNQLMVYNLIFCYAVAKGYILTNPARDLSTPTGLPKKKRLPPSQEELQKVKNSTSCTFGMFAFWAMYTGMRRGELLALDWKDVDLKARTIRINKSLYHEGNRAKIKKPKTQASIATIPILDRLLEKLEPGKGPVFPGANGYMTRWEFEKAWEMYCKESGVTATPHQFRHAYATMLFEAGIPPEEMQILLRHAQISTTMDIYREIREGKVAQIHAKTYGIDI